ncbi:Protein kinase-like domain protein [Niveomyces insectorum RCEF 264]|uniref:Protein kinase-like domain protein n=1 Tax=Niveomyces insectorum RCEF 264 TaxID=1081102 RepID=A0A167UNE4_9HYPO|nr:Protein kinase-like domain protein [Niveomyces insectorum RCEF 264]
MEDLQDPSAAEDLQNLSAEELRQLIIKERRRADEEHKRAEAERKINRNTTLLEYIELCHAHLFSEFAVQLNRKFTTGGSLTSTRNKCCPTLLKPWHGFLDEQKQALSVLISVVPEAEPLFESRGGLETIGRRLRRKIGSERDLELFQHLAVEYPVQNILGTLAERAQEWRDLASSVPLGGGVQFENHMNVLGPSPTDVDLVVAATNAAADEMAAQGGSLAAAPADVPRTPPGDRSSPWELADMIPAIRPDQICVYRTGADEGDGHGPHRVLAYVVEYKAPHKLTNLHVRAGLRPMDIHETVINRVTIPPEEAPKERFLYFAERLSAMAVTQTYDYMLQAGLELGLMTTGEVLVFLKINWAQPDTLLFHVAEPGPEVLDHPADFQYCTAVGQLLAFTLMATAADRRPHPQDERNAAVLASRRWQEDWEQILQRMEHSDRKPPPSSGLLYQPKTYKHVQRSPIRLRLRRRATAGDRRPEDAVFSTRRDRSPSPDDDDDHDGGPGTPSPTTSRKRAPSQALRGSRAGKQPQRQQDSTARQRGEQQQQRAAATTDKTVAYCTRQCLASLKQGGRLDGACPNVARHRGADATVAGRDADTDNTTGDEDCHPLTHDEFRRQLLLQFAKSLDTGIEPLSHGSRGVFFRVTLLAYGYVFSAKGTTPFLARHLRNEHQAYQRLAQLQATEQFPVCLGVVDLWSVHKRYFYSGVQVTLLLLLSWAGDDLYHCRAAARPTAAQFRNQLRAAVQQMHSVGVAHTDIRLPNITWNAARGQCGLIDFERAVLLDPPRAALGPAAPNKRKLAAMEAVPDTADAAGRVAKSQERSQSEVRQKLLFREDLGSVEALARDLETENSDERHHVAT